MLRVAHVIYHLTVGGGEVFLTDLATTLAGPGLDQRVYCIGPGGPLEPRLHAAGIPVRALGKSTRLGAATIRQLAVALRETSPNVVQLHGEGGLFWGLPAAKLAGCHAVSALIYQNYRESPAKMAATRLLLPRADVVVAGSASVRQFAIDELAAPPDRTRVIHCGIDVERFRPAHRRTARNDPRIVLTIGRLVRRKGHDVAIRALAIVTRDRQPDLELHIVGEGPERARLESIAQACGVSSRVRFLGTVWPTQNVLSTADLFLFPSLEEPQGLALLEACAAGVPVIASATGGIPEMVSHGESAILVPPGDPAALAGAMSELLSDPTRREALACAAARRVRAFDIARIAEAYADLYRTMTTETRGTARVS